MANDRDRERRRNGETCPPGEWQGSVERPAPVRPIPSCDPPIVPPEPDYQIPDAADEQDISLLITPGGLLFVSPETEVNCAEHWPANPSDGPAADGPNVTVATGTFQESYFFQTLGLSSPALDYIARVVASQEALVRELLNTRDVAGLASLLNVSVETAQEIDTAVVAIKENLVVQAETLALSQLTCVWTNELVTLSCADEYPVGEFGTAMPGAGNPVTVAAGIYSSPESQEAANELAREFARTQLTCVWGNDPITIHCSDLDLADLDPGDADPTEGGSGFTGDGLIGIETTTSPGPEFPGNPGRRRVNTVVVPANTYTSIDSKAEANAAALLAAQAVLDCFYLNPPVTVTCEDVGGVSPTINPIDYDGVTTGNPVTVEARTVASSVSWADAANQARDLGRAFLDCFWTNKEVTYACDDKDSDTTDPEQLEAHYTENYPGYDQIANKEGREMYFTALNTAVELMASPSRSAPYYVTVPAATVFSRVSQADADAQAAILAQSQLGCIYCNPRINPVCVPPEIDANTVELPIPYESVGEDWSMDVTLGVPGVRYAPAGSDEPWRPVDLFGESDAGAFLCSSDPGELSGVVDTIALVPYRQMTPASRNASCRYGNAPVYGACRPHNLPGGDVSGDSAYELPDGGIAAIPNSEFADYYSPRSTSGYVLVTGDTIYAYSKEEANAIARTIAMSQITCFFESPNLTVLCGADTGDIALGAPEPFRDPEGDPADVVYGSGVKNGFMVNAGSTGHPSHPVIVTYGAGISFASPLDALSQAVQLGLGQLDCFWKESATAYCVSKPDTRLWHVDHILINGFPSIPNSPSRGAYYNMSNQTGQLARFLYSGDQTNGTASLTPGMTIPSASATSISYESKGQAQAQALTDARSRLDCTHTNWYRKHTGCGTRNEFMARPGVVEDDTLTADSTEAANLLAEQLAITLTECLPKSPFNIGAWAKDNGGFFYKVAIGGVTNGGSDLECAKGKIGLISRKLWWDCDTPVTEVFLEDGVYYHDEKGNGEYLFWIVAQCCDEELKYILEVESYGGADGDMTDADFFPTSTLASKNSDATKDYYFIGAVKSEANPDARAGLNRSLVYVNQYADENLVTVAPTRLRFELKLKENGTEILVSPGVVHYQRLRYKKDADEDDSDVEDRKQWLTGIFPKIGTRAINDEDPPTLPAAGGGTVWLVCKDSQCTSFLPGEGTGQEKIVKTPRDDEPDLETDEIAIRICDFDIESVDGKNVMTNVVPHLQSDWTQYFACEGDFASSWPSVSSFSSPEPSESSDSSSNSNPDPSSNSSNSDSSPCPPPGWSFKYTNVPQDCYPAGAPLFGDPCTPGQHDANVTFELNSPEYKFDCEHWRAYICNLEGAEFRGSDNNDQASGINCANIVLSRTGWTFKTTWRFALAPACQRISFSVQIFGYYPNETPDPSDSPCCQTAIDMGKKHTGYLPKVCGRRCSCSSAPPP